MSASHIILDCLLYLCQNYHIWWKFDVAITKIILLVFSETRCILYFYFIFHRFCSAIAAIKQKNTVFFLSLVISRP